MTNGEKKFLLVLFVVLSLWRIFELPGVATAFWDFCTAGQIPGSTRVLAPETMIRIWIAIFMLALGVIFRKELIASLPRRVSVNAEESVAKKKVKTRKSPVVIVLPVKQRKSRLKPIFTKLKDMFFGVANLINQTLTDVAIILWRTSRLFMKRSIQATIRLWRWMDPHIRTMDAWIKAALRSNKKIAETLDAADEVWRGALQGYQSTRVKVAKIANTHAKRS